MVISTLSSSDPTSSTSTARSFLSPVTSGTAFGTGFSSTPQVQAVQRSSGGGGAPQRGPAAAAAGAAGAAAGSGVVCLVMEFLGGGSLQEAADMDALYEDDGGVDFLVLWPLLVDVARGMGALHAMGMCHGGREGGIPEALQSRRGVLQRKCEGGACERCGSFRPYEVVLGPQKEGVQLEQHRRMQGCM